MCRVGLHRLALLQLATREAIFLVDPIRLAGSLPIAVLKTFLSSFLSSPDVLKLGYGLDGDMRMLAKSWPFVVDVIGSPKRMLDLQIFEKLVSCVVQPYCCHGDVATFGIGS